jgi:glyoxylase-like metal-dependent hydrolase (beta-lactamase superfamily II)
LQPSVALFAHDNVLLRMSSPGSGVAPGAKPSLTFNDRKVFEFNGEAIEMFAEAGAHTDGDSIVFFRSSNVISTGDVFLTTGYPVIDLKRGGSIQGEINALNHILALSVPHAMQEGGTMIVPGHGRLCDQADVTEYRDMITIIRDRIADLIEKGKTLDEVKAARPTRDYDRRYSTNSWTGEMLAEAVYRSLKEGSGTR